MARPGLLQHRKFKRLARTIDSIPLALGSLELIWSSCYENGEDYLGESEDVEAAAFWVGEAGKLTKALLNAGGRENHGFIDEMPERPGHYRVHDLYDHAPQYVQKRMEREATRIQKGQTISDIRRNAANKRYQQAKDVQMDANEYHLQTNVQQTDAKGCTPAPAPAPREEEVAIATSKKNFKELGFSIEVIEIGKQIKRVTPEFDNQDRAIKIVAAVLLSRLTEILKTQKWVTPATLVQCWIDYVASNPYGLKAPQNFFGKIEHQKGGAHWEAFAQAVYQQNKMATPKQVQLPLEVPA